jgi:predicted adenine nucleotide alpha hydrolase (AANH) superfamily ATPase
MAENYKELTEDILSLYHKLGCNISLKIHMLYSHLDLHDEHGERFHQEIATIEKVYQGKWCTSMFAVVSSYTSDRQSEVAIRSGLL